MAGADARDERRTARLRGDARATGLASLPLLEATTQVGPIDGYRVVVRDNLQWLADRPVLERLRLTRRPAALRPRRAAPCRRAAGQPRPAGRLQPRPSPGRASSAPTGRDARDIDPLAQACCANPQPGFSYTLAPGDYGATASTSSGSTARKASASTSLPPSSSSCARPACRRASSPATGDGSAADRRLLLRPPELGARVGRVLAGGRRLGPCRSHRRRRARSHRPQQPAPPQPGIVAAPSMR